MIIPVLVCHFKHIHIDGFNCFCSSKLWVVLRIVCFWSANTKQKSFSMCKLFFIGMNDLQRKVSLFGRLHAVVFSLGSCPGLVPLCWDDNRHTGQILEKNWGQLTNNKSVQWCLLIRLVSMVTNAMTTEFCHCGNDRNCDKMKSLTVPFCSRDKVVHGKFTVLTF